MLKFNTSCAVLAYLSSNLLNEVGLSLFRYFEVGLYVCAISSLKSSRSLSHLLMSSCTANRLTPFGRCTAVLLLSEMSCTQSDIFMFSNLNSSLIEHL